MLTTLLHFYSEHGYLHASFNLFGSRANKLDKKLVVNIIHTRFKQTTSGIHARGFDAIVNQSSTRLCQLGSYKKEKWSVWNSQRPFRGGNLFHHRNSFGPR